jgi:GntR family transcriptional repressor for pyruvate dehydrogenase complex
MEYRRMASETPGVLKRSLADHEAIVAALQAGDPGAAESAMAAHMRNVHQSTLEAMARARPRAAARRPREEARHGG